MALEESRLKEFVSVMVTRGIGLYGRDEMAKICYDSGIGLLDDNRIEWMDDGDRNKLVQRLLINYGSKNLPAKMTAIVLARQNNIPVPDELLEKEEKEDFMVQESLKIISNSFFSFNPKVKLMVNVDKIIIFTQSGSPIVLFDFSNQQMVVDESLLSGFLSAIDGFSTQLFRSSSKQFSIDTGKSIISLFKTDKIILTCIADANVSNLGDKIQKILSEFESKHPVDSALVRDPEEFWDTRYALIRAIYRIPISEDWIVIFKNDQAKYTEYLTHYLAIFSQTEKSDVKSLLDRTKLQKEMLYTILNAGYHDGVLTFENMLEERDYVHSDTSISKLLNSNSEDYKYFKNKYPSINLTTFIQDLDCAIRIKELEKKYGNEALNLVKEMFEKKYINLIEEENRRIYIAMDLISEIIQIINELGNKKKTLELIKNALTELNDPAITHKFDLSREEAKITKDSCYAESLSESEITQITNKWLALLKIIIEANYAKYKSKLIDRIYEHFTQRYMNLSHTNDLILLDPILLMLEKYMK